MNRKERQERKEQPLFYKEKSWRSLRPLRLAFFLIEHLGTG
jgi:hypothetical protein